MADEEEAELAASGKGARARKDVAYGDNLTEKQWIKVCFSLALDNYDVYAVTAGLFNLWLASPNFPFNFLVPKFSYIFCIGLFLPRCSLRLGLFGV